MKLKLQILLFFILTTTAIVVVTGYLYYSHVQKILVEQNVNQLKAISKDKSDRVNAIIKNKMVEIGILKRSPLIRNGIYNCYNDLTDGMEKIALYNTIIRSKEAIDGINRLIVVDRKGNVIISSNPGKTTKENFSDCNAFINLPIKKTIAIDYGYNEHDELVLTLASYIDSNFIMLIENDIQPLVAVTDDFTGLGSTGETAIFNIADNNEITYLTPLRFYDKAFLVEKPKEGMEKYYSQIKKGHLLFAQIKDYQGEQVVASVYAIPQTNWRLITKMSKSETLILMDRIEKMAIWSSFGIIFFVSIIIYIVAYFFVKPINDLALVAEEISEGDLTKRVEIKSNNEVGQLGESFNKMTDSLEAIQKDLQGKLIELNRSNNELNKFAHVVSHDLKTPLNSIEGLVNLLGLELTGKIGDYEMEVVVKIKEQVKKTKELIRGILEYAEIRQKKGDAEHVDLNEVVDAVKSNIDIPSHIRFQISERLPIVQIERVLIYQVFQNLISNAVKYIDKQEGYIKLSCEKKPGAYLFSLADNGIGIDESNQNKVFEVFNTADAVKGYENSGIGLSIVKNIITEKGGSIWVESEKNVGSTFYFTLPTPKEIES